MVKIQPVTTNELPPEFKKFDKPFGLPQHVWNILWFGIVTHGAATYMLFYLFPLGYVPRWSFFYWMLVGYSISFGNTVGAHRYWTHKTFKAKMPLQIILMLMQTANMQYPIFKWCREHRVHHKCTDTDADPHSAARGFWFSHITWLFQPKHPDCMKALEIVDISDLARDPVVRFQSRYYWQLAFFAGLVFPISLCYLIFPETSWLGLITGNFARYCVSLHGTFAVNSFAHMWGDKPYDKHITSVENKWVSLVAVGEGWHNYHHTFPWDYKTSEYGIYYNLSTLFINAFAMIGWAYDLKTVSHKMLVDRINRTGDGSHPFHNNHNEKQFVKGNTSYSSCWGWGDENLRKMDLEITETVFQENNRRG